MSGHLVEVTHRTAGARLRCHTCPWSAAIDTGRGVPADADQFAALALEALTLADRHREHGEGEGDRG